MMMPSDRERWNAKFLAGEAQSAEHDPLLPEACSALSPGSALDLAGGAGRHAIWLAQRGWRVTLTDVSEEGLKLAAQRSAEAGVPIALRCESAEETLAWAARSLKEGGTRFDLIVVFWFRTQQPFAALPALLEPGGRLLYKTFTSEHPRFADGKSARFALQPGELRCAFPTLETLLDRESGGVAELVARRL